MSDVSDESERKPPQELSEEELGSLDIELAVRNIRKGNPDKAAARVMLRRFCDRAKELHFPESPFSDEYLALLISAFERYLSGEELDIAKSLGIKRGRGRPRDPNIQERDAIITMEVMHLESEGRTVTDNREGEGAFAEVAARHNLSENQVRDIYYIYEKDTKFWANILTKRLRKSDSV